MYKLILKQKMLNNLSRLRLNNKRESKKKSEDYILNLIKFFCVLFSTKETKLFYAFFLWLPSPSIQFLWVDVYSVRHCRTESNQNFLVRNPYKF